jgi:hypothetical protein
VFIYRPHLHQLDGTITPDLIVDAAQRASDGAPLLLSDAVHASSPAACAVAGCVVVGAGYGALLAPAVVLLTPAGAVTCCHLSRQAWRLADVQDHLAALALSVSPRMAGVAQPAILCGIRLDPSEPPRGMVRCAIAVHDPVPAGAESVELTLHDPVRARTLVHRLFLSAAQAASSVPSDQELA